MSQNLGRTAAALALSGAALGPQAASANDFLVQVQGTAQVIEVINPVGPVLRFQTQTTGSGSFGPSGTTITGYTSTDIVDMANGQGSPPSVIADLVVKAVHARKPRTRYAGGFLARPVMWMRKHAGDRHFDKLIMKAA